MSRMYCFQFGITLSAVLSVAVLGFADNPAGPSKASEDPIEKLRRLRGSGPVTVDLKAQIDKAIKILGEIDPKTIRRGENGTRYMYLEKDRAEWIHFLRDCRSPEAVKPLLPFIGVLFMIYEKPVSRPTGEPEMTADKALKAIGLPAVDRILQAVSQGQFDKVQRKEARQLIVDVLGTEGVKARAAFLKLSKDEKVQKFLAGK